MHLFNVDINSSIISKNMHLFLGISLNSLIICCLSSGDMYFFLLVVISVSSVSSFGNSLVDFFFGKLVILSAILLPTKSTVASAVF